LRVLGVDPGTKTFDVVVIEEDVVKVEKSIETIEVAKNPTNLIEIIDMLNADYIVAPSGYGVPITRGDEVLDPRKFAIEILLLSTEEDIERGVEVGEPGIWVYDALAKTVEHLVKKYSSKVLFLPSVILLPTVPTYRKMNKIDMGTVDKLAATFTAIHSYAEKEGIEYGDVNIVVAELGFGYNAVISVENGKIVDGIGGTYASIGTLTAGALDLEVVVRVSRWDRWDVFHGGIFHYLKVYDMNLLAKAFEKGEEPYASFFRSFIESIVKDIMRALISTPKANAILLTGRHSKVGTVKKLLQEYIKDINIESALPLKGAVISKEAGQGYAAIGEGIVSDSSVFKNLVEHMRIRDACGTVADYLFHEKLIKFKERIHKTYTDLVKNPKTCL